MASKILHCLRIRMDLDSSENGSSLKSSAPLIVSEGRRRAALPPSKGLEERPEDGVTILFHWGVLPNWLFCCFFFFSSSSCSSDCCCCSSSWASAAPST